MTQNLLPFKYQEEKESQKLIRYSGLLPILDFSKRLGFFRFADNHLRVRSGSQGWLDSQVFLSTLLINLSGGDSVSDIDHLESDEGLCAVLSHCEGRLLEKRKAELNNRFRKSRKRFFPSDNALHGYMSHFHNEFAEEQRGEYVLQKRAFIPAPNNHMKRLLSYFGHMCSFVQSNRPVHQATIDVDGVICESSKETAFYTYKKEKGYQPLNAYWYEQRLVLNTEFRDGNVPTNDKVPEFVEVAFSNLPKEINKRFLRMDTAGYNFDLMDYCGDNGVGFSISTPLCKSLKSDIKRLKDKKWTNLPFTTEQILKRPKSDEYSEESFWQWCEVPYVPDDPRGDKYRYIAIRSRIPDQKDLFDTKDEDEEEKKKSYKKGGVKYRLRVIVTNQNHLDGETLFHWHNKRCGYSEQVHSAMKSDLAGGQFPSSKFGVNAFWWIMMVISLNIIELYKQLVLGKSWVYRRMKAIRFHFIYCVGRVEKRARQIFIHLRRSMFWNNLRQRILELKWVPI
jgi:hypothetical protein